MKQIFSLLACITILHLAFAKIDHRKFHHAVAKHGGHHHDSRPYHYNINLHKMKVKKEKKPKKQHVIHNNYYSYPLYDYPSFIYPKYVSNEFVIPSKRKYPKMYAKAGFDGHQDYHKGRQDDAYEGHKDVHTYHEVHHHGHEHQKKGGSHSPDPNQPIYEEHKNRHEYDPKEEKYSYSEIPSKNSKVLIHVKDKAYKKVRFHPKDSERFDYARPGHQKSYSKGYKDIYTYPPEAPESENYRPTKGGRKDSFTHPKFYESDEYSSKDYGKNHRNEETDYNGNKGHNNRPKAHGSGRYIPTKDPEPHGYNHPSHHRKDPAGTKEHERGGYSRPKDSFSQHEPGSKGYKDIYTYPEVHDTENYRPAKDQKVFGKGNTDSERRKDSYTHHKGSKDYEKGGYDPSDGHKSHHPSHHRQGPTYTKEHKKGPKESHGHPSHKNQNSKGYKDIYTYPEVTESTNYSPAKDQKAYGKETKYSGGHKDGPHKEWKGFKRGQPNEETDCNHSKVHYINISLYHESGENTPSKGYGPQVYNHQCDCPKYIKGHEKAEYSHPKESYGHSPNDRESDHFRPKHHADNFNFGKPYAYDKPGHTIHV